MRTRIGTLGTALGGLALLFATACSESQAKGAAISSPGALPASTTLPDRPLEAYQARLLDLAFRAASEMPLMPHAKNRSRAQDAVIATMLELGQPNRALADIPEIENWRQGTAWADLAYYCADEGAGAQEVQRYLDQAHLVAESIDLQSEDTDEQEWTKERILAKIAAAHLRLGQPEHAELFAAGVGAGESGRIQAERTRSFDEGDVVEQLAFLERALQVGDLSQILAALQATVELHGRFYDDAELRGRIEAKIRESLLEVPLSAGIEIQESLAESALEHEDRDAALAFAMEAQSLLDGTTWIAEDKIPLMARLASLRHRCGEAAAARRQADEALALFGQERDRIADVFRAEALIPLAEAYSRMGDAEASLRVFRTVVEESVLNPNSRPRSEDLAAACCAMARVGVEPDAALWKRLDAEADELGPPW